MVDLANHERLMAGAAAGAAAASVCYPLEALRTQMGGELELLCCRVVGRSCVGH